jgi:hypothetical protein
VTVPKQVRVRIGVAMILASIAYFGGWLWWESTRNRTPLDIPISVSQDHLRTPKFCIDNAGLYKIQMSARREFDYWGVPCLLGVNSCDGNPAPLQVSWMLSTENQVVAHGNSDGIGGGIGGAQMVRNLGYIEAGKGEYVLNLEIAGDGQRLNRSAPRVTLTEPDFLQEQAVDAMATAFSLSLFLAAGGVYLVRSKSEQRRENAAVLRQQWSLTQRGPQPRDLQPGVGSAVAVSVQFSPRPAAHAWVGMVLLFAGLGGCTIAERDRSRALVVDMPVSLAAGHVRTGAFHIESGGYYSVGLHTTEIASYGSDCSDHALLRARWVLSRAGRAVDGNLGIHELGWLGSFQVDKGVYDLDLEILKDAACLNAGRPRLTITSYSEPAGGLFVLFLCLCGVAVAVGMVVVARDVAARLRRPLPAVAPDAGNGTTGGKLRWKRRPDRARPFSGLTYPVLVIVFTLSPLLEVMAVAHAQYRRPLGFLVHLTRPGIAAPSQPWIQPILMRLESRGPTLPPDLYLNSQPVSWEDLATVLQTELNKRPPQWPVYVKGDPEMEWRWAAKAIDVAQGLHAQVTLLGRNER